MNADDACATATGKLRHPNLYLPCGETKLNNETMSLYDSRQRLVWLTTKHCTSNTNAVVVWLEYNGGAA